MIRRVLAAVLIAVLMLGCMVTPSFAEEKTLLKAQPIEISHCDDRAGWSSNGQLYLDRNVKVAGDASIGVRTTIPAYSQTDFYVDYSFAPVNVFGMEMLEFDLYLSDLDLLDSTMLLSATLSSSGNNKKQALTWSHSLYAKPFHVGWNHVKLSFDEAATAGFSAENANYFSLNFGRVTPLENKTYYVQIDNLRAYGYDREMWVFDDCNGNFGWGGFPEPRDVSLGKDGSYCHMYAIPLTADIPSGERRVVVQRRFDPIDVSWATHMEMDIYMSDLSVLEKSTYGLQFELTSSGTCDRNEYMWTVDNYVWKTGWNHIRLPLAAAHHNGGELDLTAANFMRFHIINIEPVMNEWVLMVDNVAFSAVIIPDEPEEPDTPDVPTNPEAPADPEIPDAPEIPDTPDEPEIPGDTEDKDDDRPEDTPTFDPTMPPVITPVITPVEPEGGATEAETAKSYTKAKALAVVMVFGVIGTDVAMVIRRKEKEKNGKEAED